MTTAIGSDNEANNSGKLQAVVAAQRLDDFPDFPATVIEVQAVGVQPGAVPFQHVCQHDERQRLAVHQRAVAVEQYAVYLPA